MQAQANRYYTNCFEEKDMSEISLIVSVYKRVDKLQLLLNYLEKQTCKNFEVIIAEDDNSNEIKSLIQISKEKYSFKIKHVFQEDEGFRKCKILNRAILVSESDFLVFTDGDCILHPHFIDEYKKIKKGNAAYVGRRVMLSEKLTHTLLSKNMGINFFNLLLYKCKRIEDGIYSPLINKFKQRSRGIWGCNWGISKQHLLAINGFDEDYIKPGIGEDTDIEWRLKRNGVQLKSMRFKAIVYHLFHIENYNSTKETEELMRQKKLTDHFKCINGITKSSSHNI